MNTPVISSISFTKLAHPIPLSYKDHTCFFTGPGDRTICRLLSAHFKHFQVQNHVRPDLNMNFRSFDNG